MLEIRQEDKKDYEEVYDEINHFSKEIINIYKWYYSTKNMEKYISKRMQFYVENQKC